MFLKRDVIDILIENGISKFVLIGENVLQFFGESNEYYEEWYEDIKEVYRRLDNGCQFPRTHYRGYD